MLLSMQMLRQGGKHTLMPIPLNQFEDTCQKSVSGQRSSTSGRKNVGSRRENVVSKMTITWTKQVVKKTVQHDGDIEVVKRLFKVMQLSLKQLME